MGSKESYIDARTESIWQVLPSNRRILQTQSDAISVGKSCEIVSHRLDGGNAVLQIGFSAKERKTVSYGTGSAIERAADQRDVFPI